MARSTWVLRNGELVEKHLAAPRNQSAYVRTDGMDPILSHADGRMYDSKSAYYASVKRSGSEIVGNDTSIFRERQEYRPEGVEQSIKQAIQQLSSGERRGY
jgi:hypothetical protein